MKTEYEVRMLNIDVKEMLKKAKEKGAIKIGQFHQKRYVYDFTPIQKGSWIRLRSNGKKTTLAIKEIKSLKIDGTKEIEIEVSDFETTNSILKKLGYNYRTYQENYRIELKIDNVILDFDKWPLIPPYLEIEGKRESDIKIVMEKLGINAKQVTTLDVNSIYKEQHNINLDEIKSLCFNEEEKNFIMSIEGE